MGVYLSVTREAFKNLPVCRVPWFWDNAGRGVICCKGFHPHNRGAEGWPAPGAVVAAGTSWFYR